MFTDLQLGNLQDISIIYQYDKAGLDALMQEVSLFFLA